jgi:cell division protein FtsL
MAQRKSEETQTTRRLTPAVQDTLVVLGTLLITSMIVCILLLQVWNRVQVFELGYEMSALTKEREALMEEEKRLRVEGVISATTERLEKVAREDLGLRPIRPEQVVIVGDRRTASVVPEVAP